MSKFLSRADLERIASTVVNRYYEKHKGNAILPEPVDPDLLAGEVFGLSVSYLPLSKDGSVLGMTSFRETEIELCSKDGAEFQINLTGRDILIDDALLDEGQVGRRNFTTAHEVAHHTLVQLYPEDYREILECRTHILYRRRSRERNWAEWQADTIAAAMLMPPQTLIPCMAVFGLGGKLDMLSSVCRAREYDRFCDIASYLGVSKKALAIRMKQLGMLGEEYLENPYAPLDVYKDEDDG